jgi:hypothetical protein
LFSPDPRCRFHQRFCAKAACRRASKAESQRKWKRKPENLRYWWGEKIFEKLAAQRGNGEKLQPSAKGDEKMPEVPLLAGVFGVLCSSSSKETIERFYRSVIILGREILRRHR